MSKGKINEYRSIMGRPTEYKGEETLKMMREYIAKCVDGYEDVPTGKVKRRGKKSKIVGYYTEKKFRVRIPTLEGLAIVLGVHKETIQAWKKTHDEFSVLIAELLHIQGERLVARGLSGDYNPTITKVLLTKHGYREGLEHTGEDGAALFRPSDDEKKAAEKALDAL